MVTPVWLVLAILLAVSPGLAAQEQAAGGGGAAGGGTPVGSATIAKTRFLAFGDSITFGVLCPPSCSPPFGSSAGNAWSYPAVLHNLLSQRYASQQITTINAGLPGEWAADGLIRAPGEINTHDPDVFLLLEGVNALLIQGVPFVASDLRGIVQGAQAAGVDVLIATLTPIGDQREAIDPGLRAAVAALNAEIQQIASDLNIAPAVDIHGAVSADPAFLGIDGLHPTVAGYAAMGQAFFDAIVARFEDVPVATLSVTRTGAGAGTVTSVPGSINCGGVCSEAFAPNTVVTLSAIAAPMSTFAGFHGAPDCADGTVALSADMTCTARFNLDFTDDPVAPGDTAKALHVVELQQRVNAVRVNRCSSGAYGFAPVSVGSVIRAIHILELRTAIHQAETACGRPTTAFSNPELGAGSLIRAAHISELRAATVALE